MSINPVQYSFISTLSSLGMLLVIKVIVSEILFILRLHVAQQHLSSFVFLLYLERYSPKMGEFYISNPR